MPESEDDRARRIAQNEAVFRKVNEQIEGLNRGMAEISDEQLHLVCECGDLGCADQIVVPIGDYERVRGDDELFFVKEGHELPSVEHVVEQTRAYTVVRKDTAPGRQVAEATDPRGS